MTYKEIDDAEFEKVKREFERIASEARRSTRRRRLGIIAFFVIVFVGEGLGFYYTLR